MKSKHTYEKETTRIWGNPLKWMRQAVTPWESRSEFVFASYRFPPTLLCNVKETYLPIYLNFTANKFVENEQNTSLPWSNSPATAPKCWVKLSLVNLPSINCQPGYVYFELLHYMCGQSSLNAHTSRNSSLLTNKK